MAGSGRRIRVGIDGSLACSKRPTGVEWFARAMLAELIHLAAPDVDWFLYLPPYGDPGVPIPPHVSARYRPDVNTLIKTPWLVAQTWRDRLDVVHAFGHLLPNGCRGRRLITVHDTAFDAYPDCYPAGDAERAHAQVAEACAKAARIVVPSDATRANLIRDYGYPEARIDILYEGARPNFSPGQPGPLPEKVRAAGITGPFLLCVGRIDRRKNLERVIQAYREVVRAGTPCGGLVIAGPEDSGSAEVRQRLADGTVPGERIVATGYVTDEELVDLYRAAAALVYPSLAEGFGLPVLEAMTCGTPVITSNVSSMPEVAGNAGLLVDPADTAAIAAAMRLLLTDPEVSERLKRDGRAQAARFSWKASAERLLDSVRRTANQS